MNKIERRKLNIKLPIFFIIIISLVIITIYHVNSEYNNIIDERGETALSISRAISIALDHRQYEEMMASRVTNDYYYEFLEFLDELTLRVDAQYIYIMSNERNGHFTYFMEGMPSKYVDANVRIELGDTESAEFHYPNINAVFRIGGDYKTKVYAEGGYDAFVTGFSMIHNEEGRVIGIIGVDLDVQEQISFLYRTGIVSFIVMLIATGLIFFILNNYERMVQKLATTKSGTVEALFEQKLSEQLKIDNTRLKALIKSLKIALWEVEVIDHLHPFNDEETKCWWSDEFREQLGFSDERSFPNLISNWVNRIHPEDKESVFEKVRSNLKDYTGKTPFDFICRMRMKNETYRYIHAIGSTIRDDHGIPIRIIGGTIDVTDTKTIKDRIQLMIDSSPIAIQIFNNRFDIIDCNEVAVKLFKVKDKGEFSDSFIVDYSPKEQPGGRSSIEKANVYLERAFKEGKIVFDWTFVIPKTEETFLTEITLIRVGSGDEGILIAYVRDLRDQEDTIGQMKEKSLWYKAILDAIQAPIGVTDEEMNWSFINRAMELELSKKREELYGSPGREPRDGATQFIHKDQRYRVEVVDKKS